MLRLFDLALRVIACALLVALLVVVMLGVITRGLGEPLIWTDEGSRFLMAWLAAAGWMLASRSREHVRIRFFQNLLPPGLWWATELLIQLSAVLFGAATAGLGMVLVFRNSGLEALTLPISMACFYFPLVPAGLTIALQSGADMLWRLKRPAASDVGGRLP